MNYFEQYVAKIRERGNAGLAESVTKTADEVGSRYLENFSFMSHEIGLLMGNVQSGKTGQMFGIMCRAADLGFPVFLLLTTDNVVLQQQTLDRVQSDLEGFCICGENDGRLFVDNNLEKPAIIVLKKNGRVLKLWDSIINSTDFMRGNPLFIVDDEADAASLNTMINRHRQSSINRYLDSIKSGASSSLYLQVTGTPQALLLQAKETGWHPLFTYYFKPGKGYLGGDFFFPEDRVPSCIALLEDAADPLAEAVLHHLTVSAISLAAGKNVCNFMIHPSVRITAHSKFAQSVRTVLDGFRTAAGSADFEKRLRQMWEDIEPERLEKPEFAVVYDGVRNLLEQDLVQVIILNGKHDTDSSVYASGSNIIIGGNTLGRGVTFGGLQTILYTRSSKKPQADTMWQHSRMFGYDRDPGMMKVYIEDRLYKLFADINATNNAMIAQIEKGIEQVRIYYPEGLNPTRKNVLDKSRVFALSGGTNYFPMEVDNDSIDELDKMLAKFEDTTESYTVNLRLIRELLGHIQTDPEFPLTSFVSVLDMFLAEKPGGQGILIVRRERDIRRGARALLSPTDWNIGGAIEDKLVLTLYKMTGGKGWQGCKVWVPNIKLPDDVAYYDVAEDKS